MAVTVPIVAGVAVYDMLTIF